jgi:arabinofuranosyltransferase
MPDKPDSQAPALAAPKKVARVRAIALGAMAIALVFGALQLAFLCDDAFILFRYVSNARDGHGLVWNPPPFEPVEGYTQFLWLLLLWATWSWFGVEPPASANMLSILFGLGMFAVVAFAAFRIRNRGGTRSPDALAYVALAAVVGNRTFLQSLTGGLDTSLFNLAFVSWVLLAFRAPDRRTHGWLATWAAAAAVTALTQPDGLLCVAATGALGVTWSLRRNDSRFLLSLAPLLAVAAHSMWRRSFYGAWLPDTCYAEVAAPGAEAGIRYLECFCFENGGWIWLPIALVWLLLELRRGPKAALRRHADNLPAVTAVAATLAHVGYYVLCVGGDPFEYRVLSHLIPLGALSAAAMVAGVCSGALAPIACTVALGLGASVGWIHLALTEHQPTPDYVPLAAKVPQWLQPFVRWHDRNQAWLHAHVVCGRRHQHALFVDTTLAALPERTRMTVDANDLPVASLRGVGVAGWVLPDCFMIDMHSLDDWFVARAVRSLEPWPPKEVWEAALAPADKDGDANLTRGELEAALAAVPGGSEASSRELVTQLLLCFAVEDAERLTATEAQQIVPFLEGLRLMRHDGCAPVEYVGAFDPNVTVVDRKVVVRKRAQPLTATRVRAIEQQWRVKMQ